jgi:hypothetical protein
VSKYIRKADRANLPQAALAKHGIYATSPHQEAIFARHPEITAYLRIVRRGLVRDLSPEGEAHMSTAKHVILDRLMGKLKMSGLIEAYLAENGIIRRDKLAQKVLEPEPITSLWLALNHQIRLDLQLLGLERKALDAELTVLDVIAEFDKDKAAKAAEAGKTALLRPVEGKTIEGADIVAGDSGTPTGKED